MQLCSLKSGEKVLDSVQCALTNSLGVFPGYWDWLGYPVLPPRVGVHASPFPLSPSISRCFSIHSSHAIGFHSCFFFTTDLSAPIRSTIHLLMVSIQAWYMALVANVVVLEAEHEGCMKQKSHFKFLPRPGFETRTLQSNGRERYH